MPGFHAGRSPRNKGLRYPADPPTVDEIIAVMRAAGDSADGARLRALIVILWRAGLRIGEVLDLAETDLDRSRGAVLVRNGKGGRRREVGMDRWALSQLELWMEIRGRLPVGALVCVIHGSTAGRHWEQSARASSCGASQVRLACGGGSHHISCGTRNAVEMAHEGVPLVIIHASSGMPTSGSRRSISKGSTARRSLTRSTRDRRR
jgi:integrase